MLQQSTILLIALTLVACSPKIRTSITTSHPPLNYKEEVIVLSLADKIPTGAVTLGRVKIGDTGFTTKCDWNIVINEAKLEARKAGGNILRIVEHKPPSMASTCHRIEAAIMRIENPEEVKKSLEAEAAPKHPNWNYALVHIYRPGGTGALVGYDLYLGDSVICRVKNNSAQKIKIHREGMNLLWAKTESRSEMPIDVKFGKTYYLRCTIGIGIMIGRPQLELVDAKLGKLEYSSINRNKK